MDAALRTAKRSRKSHHHFLSSVGLAFAVVGLLDEATGALLVVNPGESGQQTDTPLLDVSFTAPLSDSVFEIRFTDQKRVEVASYGFEIRDGDSLFVPQSGSLSFVAYLIDETESILPSTQTSETTSIPSKITEAMKRKWNYSESGFPSPVAASGFDLHLNDTSFLPEGGALSLVLFVDGVVTIVPEPSSALAFVAALFSWAGLRRNRSF